MCNYDGADRLILLFIFAGNEAVDIQDVLLAI